MNVIKNSFFIIVVLVSLNGIPVKSYAEAPLHERHVNEISTQMQEDTDGVLQNNEFEYVSTNKSVTRSLCPYDCSERGLPQEDCRSWKSIIDPTKCYIQDLKIPSNAIEFK